MEYIDSSLVNAGCHVIPYNIPIKEPKMETFVKTLRNISISLIEIIAKTMDMDITEYFIASLNINKACLIMPATQYPCDSDAKHYYFR